MDFIGKADFGTEKLNPLYDAVTSSSKNESLTPANVLGAEKSASHAPFPNLFTDASERRSPYFILTLHEKALSS